MSSKGVSSEEDRQLEEVAEILSQETGRAVHADELGDRTALLSMMEMTSGAYPPPSMLRDYKQLDEGLFQQIVDGAEHQRDHRMAIERAEASHSRSLRRWGQIGQFALAFFGLSLSAAMVAIPAFFAVSVPWPVPVAVAVLGVGGLPAATIMARLFASRRDD